MRVLIVDDDNARSESLRSHLLRTSTLTPGDISVVGCVDDAKSALRASYFDVLVLDVVLPQHNYGRRSSTAGLALLRQLSRSGTMQKPERIIGITAHVDDLGEFRTAFEAECQILLQADNRTVRWLGTVSSAIQYTGQSKLSRTPSQAAKHILSVHGIRTFGGWQDRLEVLVRENIPLARYSSYKYGVYSAFAFFMPPLRSAEVRRLEAAMASLFDEAGEGEVTIFTHSFGTYLAAFALKRLIATRNYRPVLTLVLGGSVLPRHFDWAPILEVETVRVVNDCGDSDFVLYASEALVWGTGMAGKVGFVCSENDRFRNRFFPGGHSLYFECSDFMIRRWVPLLANGPIPAFDARSHSVIKHEIVDGLVLLLGRLKPVVYGTFGLAGMYFSYKWMSSLSFVV